MLVIGDSSSLDFIIIGTKFPKKLVTTVFVALGFKLGSYMFIMFGSCLFPNFNIYSLLVLTYYYTTSSLSKNYTTSSWYALI